MNAYLMVHAADGTLSTVAVTFAGCGERGIDNGATVHQLITKIVKRIMDGVQTSYEFEPFF